MPTEVNNSPAGDRDQVYGECLHPAASRYRQWRRAAGKSDAACFDAERAGVKHDPLRRITLIPWKETLGYR
jgi:hypothetical protein